MVSTFLSLSIYLISCKTFSSNRSSNVSVRKIINIVKLIIFCLIIFIGYIIAWLTGDKP